MSTPIRRAIYGRLASDTTLNALLGSPPSSYSKSIYYQEAPEGAGYPLVILNLQSDVPTEAFSDPSAFETDTWLAKAIDCSSSADTAEAIQARLRQLLNDAPLSIAGSVLMYLRRQSGVNYPETTAGVQYKHAGDLYRLVYD